MFFSCKESIGFQQKLLFIDLGNNFALEIYLHKGQEIKNKELDLGEQDLHLKRPDGTRKLIYSFGGIGEPELLVIDDEKNRISIQQNVFLGDKDIVAHELALKISEKDGGFYYDKACQLDFSDIDQDYYGSRRVVEENLFLNGLHGVFKLALSSNEFSHELFYDKDFMAERFYGGAFIGSLHLGMMEFLESYTSLCFKKKRCSSVNALSARQRQ